MKNKDLEMYRMRKKFDFAGWRRVLSRDNLLRRLNVDTHHMEIHHSVPLGWRFFTRIMNPLD